jgi:hypothetical protein
MVVQAVDAYLPAIEIVDDRYANWQTLGAPTLPPGACSARRWHEGPRPICAM